MSDLVDRLRSGAWLTRARIRIHGLTFVGIYAAACVFLLATARGGMDIMGRPLGTDFSEVWVAGKSALAGHPEAPFDPARHQAAQQFFFGPGSPFYGWHYPPYFLVWPASPRCCPTSRR